MMVLRIPRASLPLLLLLGAGACDDIRRAAQQLVDRRTPRERYVDALASAGLGRTALGVDWVAAGERALREAPVVTSPYEEQGFFAPGEPVAVAMRIQVRRGQEVTLTMDLPGDTSTMVFLDAWTIADDSSGEGMFSHLASADSAERVFRVSPRRDGAVVLRAQPELLRGGRFRASLRIAPTLAFPVRPGSDRDIGSRFGAPRAPDRSHQGIDIFARRGTPVVAAATGVVNRVNETPIGGRVVWLRDTFGNSLYYAHLDSQAVSSGMHVDIGDTLGFVGNTGNARTTPPHLHFGVYRRGEGPIDPYWFVYRPRGAIPRLVADTNRLGRWIRPSGSRALLLAAPSAKSDTVGLLGRHAAMRVVSASGDYYRVRLPDGGTGFINARLTEFADRAIATLAGGRTLLARPVANVGPADIIAVIDSRESVSVLARFGEFALVRNRRGAAGWVLSQ
jgi:peptidoglycan LD-endopeptidase LytH